MKDLTEEQVMTALRLAKNPLITSVNIEANENNISRISIKSVIGAKQKDVDKLIESTLGKLFPGYEYMYLPAKYVSPVDQIEEELYFINYDGETLIDLTMRIGPVKWTPKDILRNEG
ncbi:MAG: hypothetical protein M0Z35_07165 [Desulfitobacterium hafniense]|nr:hypothetical protein [Desulfitobacterium hafniense]